MTNENSLIIGTGADYVFYLEGQARPRHGIHSARPTFLAGDPGARYGVSEIGRGQIVKFADEDTEPAAQISSGGSFPCHIVIHPSQPWAYVANYGDGVVRAVELTDTGFGEAVDLPHFGSGPRADRQECSHAHFAAVLGDYLVVADLGTDELRAYPLANGRPGSEPVLTAMPAGSGPRHFVAVGSHLHVAGELDGTITVVAWDEAAGTGTVQRSVAAATLPGDHYLSHIDAIDGHTIVGVRGCDSLSLLDSELNLVQEVPTGAWPRHFAIHPATPAEQEADADLVAKVLVAGERADAVVRHDLRREAEGLRLGEVTASARVSTPMYIGMPSEGNASLR